MENNEYPKPDVEQRRLKWWTTFVLGGVLVVGIVVLAVGLRLHSKRVPVYKGKAGDQWLAQMLSTNQREAIKAFREMDTNGSAYLVRVLGRRETAWDRYYNQLYVKAPPEIKAHLSTPIIIPDTWMAAQMALANLPVESQQKVLPDLIELMGNRESQSQLQAAALVINMVKPQDVDDVPALARCLKDPNRDIRHSSALALKKLGPNAIAAVPDLVKALNDPEPDARAAIAWALWNINQQTNGVIEALQSAMKEQRPGYMRNCTVSYLCQVTPKDVALIPELVTLVQVSDDFAAVAAEALGKYGPAAISAMQALEYRAQTGRAGIKEVAADALKKIEGSDRKNNWTQKEWIK